MGRYQVLGTRLIFETFFWPLSLLWARGPASVRRYMGPPKEILFEIDLVPGTWYLGKDLRLENPRAMWSGREGAMWRYQVLGTRLIFETFFWGPLSPAYSRRPCVGTCVLPRKYFLKSTWYLVPGTSGKDLRLENPRAMWSGREGFALSGAVWRCLALSGAVWRRRMLSASRAAGGRHSLSPPGAARRRATSARRNIISSL